MIRIRVIKAYELAVAAAAVLLAAALIALAVAAFSGRTATDVETLAPHSVESMPGFGEGGVRAMDTQESAMAVFSASSIEGEALFGAPKSLRVAGEAFAPMLHAQGERMIDWTDVPSVLIYHTHTYEAYTMEEDGLYEETEQWRTANSQYNVVRVGDALAQELRALGVHAVHDDTNHELPVLGTAYARSLETVSARMEAGEQYDLCIDLHRDAYCAGLGENTVDTPGGKAAKILFLVGRGDNFSIKPDTQANLELACRLTDALNTAAPGLCKDVLEKENRYNQHLGGHALLIEAGNNFNTISEVLRAVPYLARAIAAELGRAETQPVRAEYMELSGGAP